MTTIEVTPDQVILYNIFAIVNKTYKSVLLKYLSIVKRSTLYADTMIEVYRYAYRHIVITTGMPNYRSTIVNEYNLL